MIDIGIGWMLLIPWFFILAFAALWIKAVGDMNKRHDDDMARDFKRIKQEVDCWHHQIFINGIHSGVPEYEFECSNGPGSRCYGGSEDGRGFLDYCNDKEWFDNGRQLLDRLMDNASDDD